MNLEDPYEGQKFSSFEVLKKYLEEYGKKNFVKFWIRSSHRIGSLKSKATKKVNPSLKYICMKFACIFGGEKIRCRGSGIRRSSTFRNLGCPCTINAVIGEDGNHVKLETVILEHNHVLCKSLFETLKKSKSKLRLIETEVRMNKNSLLNENIKNIISGKEETSRQEGNELLQVKSNEEECNGGSVRDDKTFSCEQNNFQEYFKQIQEKYGNNIKIIVVNREESEMIEGQERESDRITCQFVKEEEEEEEDDEEEENASNCENSSELEQLIMSEEKEICRLCLSTSNKLSPIFKPSSPLESTILSFKIMSCASIEIRNDDELPGNICSTCEEILDIAYNFRMRCEKSDSVLRKFYSSSRFIDINGISNGCTSKRAIAEELQQPEEVPIKIESECKETVKGIGGESLPVLPGEDENEIYSKFGESCPVCGNSFSNYSDVLTHLKEHDEAGNYLLTCNFCSEIFTTVRTLVEHVNEHITGVSTDWTNRVIACNHCEMTFLTEEEAKAHGESHLPKEESDLKPSENGFLCNICGKILKSKDRFQSHRNTHEGLRPHICLKCGKGFADRKNMHQHYDIVHLRKAKHECPICHKKFYAPTKMKSHITMHYGVKPFSCDICNKTFRLRMNMVKHKKTHSNERPYKCDKCSAAFIDKNLLTRHSYVHGGVRPYVCPYCSHRFTLRFSLKKHMTSGRCGEKGKARETSCEFPLEDWGNQTEEAVISNVKCEDGEFPEESEAMQMLEEYGQGQ